MLRHKAMVDHRRTGCDLHTADFGYGKESEEQPLRSQNGELEMFLLLISYTSNLCQVNGFFSLTNYFMIVEQVL